MPLEGDTRKEFIITTAVNYFGVGISSEAQQTCESSDDLNRFLDDPNCFTVTVSRNADSIVFSYELPVGKVKETILVFFKLKPSAITRDNVHDNVFVSSMVDSPLAGLYYTIQRVYAPALLQGSKWEHNVEPKLQTLVSDLEAGLRCAVLKSGSSGKKDHSKLAGIMTVEDELDYWITSLSEDKSKKDKEMYSSIIQFLEPLVSQIKSLESKQLSDAEEFLDTALNALDDIWKIEEYRYPQHRMQNLMEIIGNNVTRFIQIHLVEIDFWRGCFSSIEDTLTLAISVCEKWVGICYKLTNLFWPNNSFHIWSGKPFMPQYIKKFLERLHEILQIRIVEHQMSRLLSLEEKKELSIENYFNPFSGLSSMQYNTYTEPLWRAAVEQFNSIAQPAEEKVAEKLKYLLNGTSNNILQLMQEVLKYSELFQRPAVQNVLVAERELILSQLQQYVANINSQASGEELSQLLDVPPLVANIYKVRQLESKMNDVSKIGNAMLKSLKGYNELESALSGVRSELKESHTKILQSWTVDTLQAINSKTLGLKTEEAVVGFDNEGKWMKVNFSDDLVNLVKEVRHISALGYQVNSNIMEAAKTAQTFVSQAKLLTQVATFHNSIGDRMISSQRAMMLNTARNLAKLVHSQHTVKWNDLKEVDEYTRKMQSQVEILVKQNNELVGYHQEVMNTVESLVDIELFKQEHHWKEALKHIRQLVNEVEDKFSNTKSWRAHIDYQIYKILDYQYQYSLSGSSELLPETRLDLVYRRNRVEYFPSLRAVRQACFRRLKRFLLTPMQIRSVGETNIYPAIIYNNARKLGPMLGRLEDSFKELEKLCSSWEEWVALSQRTTEEYAQELLTDPQGWSENFKASKSMGQQIAKLPSNEIKVDFFVVGVTGVRGEVELQNRLLWDNLKNWLRSSILGDMARVRSFMDKAMVTLSDPPQKIDDIGEANEKHKQVLLEGQQIVIVLEEVDRKNKVLRIWTKENLEQVNQIKNDWMNFQMTITNYHFLIGKHVEVMKTNLESERDGLIGELERLRQRWDEARPRQERLVESGTGAKVLEESLIVIRANLQEWNHLSDKISKLKDNYTKFSMEPPDFKEWYQIENDIKDCEESWSLMETFKTDIDELGKDEWIIYRSKSYQKLDSLLSNWTEKLKNQATSSIVVKLMQELDKYREMLPALKYVRGEMFTEKHWLEVFTLLKAPFKPVQSLKFSDFLETRERLKEHINVLQDINSRAAGEIVIRQALSELDIWEVESKFTVVPHIDSQGTKLSIIKDFKSIMNKVGDNQCLLQSIKGSPNYDHFEDRTSLWEKRLSSLDEYLRNLNQIQRKWLYLEPILSNSLLERARFQRVDKELRYIISELSNAEFRVVTLTKLPNIGRSLNQLLQHLNQCQKSLMEFLEEKRLQFPRFYFLSDDDLLEILGQSEKPSVIQSHLKKVFSGIHSVTFSGNTIVSMCSSHGEIVDLNEPVTITQNVEEWLGKLAKEMKSTLKRLVKHCLENPDPSKFPSQILCLTEDLLFTKRAEQAIKSERLMDLRKEINEHLHEYTRQQVELSGGENQESGVLELKLKALLLDTIYHMSVVDDLLDKNVISIDDWHWQKRLRFYLGKDGSVIIRMVDAEFRYSYEYQGNAPKLVHTPLTDICYLTLTQAMSMGLGGNPLGPAGTGKTESVKALGGLLGRQVLVFNCDEGIDVQSLTRILVGLVKCGAWGCFDEFNRLEEVTLSAISQQIQPIQQAFRSGEAVVNLLGKEIELDKNTGIFVTLNPAGKGYGGRQKLPENLKQLFRPVIMSKPNDSLIAEVILHCEGFKQAPAIGQKLVTLVDLARKMLSPQQHYDWGLRALKTVLGSCGTALRNHLLKNGTANNEKEMELVVQAIRLNTLCKLTFADCKRFDDLMRDVFPGINFISSGHEQLQTAIKESYSELGLVFNERQNHKCLELYEQLQQRMGVVVVGEASCGKSTIINLLKQALGKLGVKVRHNIINPKAMPKHQLLGQIDLDTRQWTDGVLTFIAQEVYNEPQDIECWIHCDGDIDPEWIESLNSVLDDNRLLTLPSGWRIQFGRNVHFLFETDHLKHASPATVSRMGMILLSIEDLDLVSLVDSWLMQQPPEDCQFLSELITSYFHQAISWVVDHRGTALKCSMVTLVNNGLSLMSGVTSRSQFIVALINGIGALLTPTMKTNFAKMVLELAQEFLPDQSMVEYCFYNRDRDSIEVHEMTVNTTDQGLSLIETPLISLTMDIVSRWLETNQSFILLGPSGCGKSMLLETCFQKLRGVQVTTTHCSGQTMPSNIVQKLSQDCMLVSSNTGRIFRPKNGERLILHFSDVNLIHGDKWGTTMLISFLQQIITYNGFYDSNLEWIGFEKVHIVCSLSCVENISERFISINRILYLRDPDKSELISIYGIYVKQLFGYLKPDLDIPKIMVELYETVKENHTPLQHPHYIFTTRDITRWCVNIQRYGVKTIESFYEALVHEAMRLFKDKLVSEEERMKFDDNLRQSVRKFGESFNKVYAKDVYYIGERSERVMGNGSALTRIDSTEWTGIVRENILLYGGESTAEKILLLPELLQMTAIIDRALTQDKGGLLLVGKAGYGRKTALRIVAARHNATVQTPRIVDNYNVSNFTSDLKAAIQTAAVDGNKVYFLLEEFQLLESEFLDMVNSLISSGEVPGLYQFEELENLSSPMKNMMTHYDGTSLQFFNSRVQENLRVVFVFDNLHPQFDSTLRANPAILEHCCVFWCRDWSWDTMKLISSSLALEVQTMTVSPEDAANMGSEASGLLSSQTRSSPKDSTSSYNADRGSLRNKHEAPEETNCTLNDVYIETFPAIHEKAGSFTDVSPRKYFAFIETFVHLRKTKHTTITERQEKLEAGLSKLTEARNTVDSLKIAAAEQNALLAEKQEKSKKVLDKISDTMASANMQKNEMEALRENTEKENKVLQARKWEIDQELSEIEPLIQEARAAVGNIKSEALSEIRSLRAPPKIIRNILEGVIRLMGIEDTSWNSMKTFLAKRGVKEDIRCFDASQITEESREAVEKILESQKDSFDPRNAKRASVAAAPLAAWVKANVQYSHVLQKILPLEVEQARLQRNLQIAADQIGELGSGLDTVDAAVAKLKEQLNTSSKEAAEIEIHLNKAQETLTAAEGLVLKLDNEYSVWQIQLSELSKSLEKLQMSCLLSAAIVTYLADCSEDTRTSVTKEWRILLGIEDDFSLTDFLCSESELLQWGTEGLPGDLSSRQNAVIILHTTLCPLLLDPSQLATFWLKSHLAGSLVEVISQQSSKFNTILELAIRFGKILIVQDVSDIHPLLIPVLRGDFILQGSRKMIMVGEKLVDFNNNFKIFLTSRNISPNMTPDSKAVITTVNFQITREGLTQQLLQLVLKEEKPLLEKRREELLQEEETLKSKLSFLQENVLRELANAQGNILQNQELLASLQKSKESSLAIQESLKESKKLQDEMKKEYDIYQPLAQHGAKLYFTCATLYNMNNMYHISISSYLKLFQISVSDTKVIDEMVLKSQNLLHFIFKYISRSLFKRDRLVLALYIIHEMYPGLFQQNEWEVFTGHTFGDAKVDPAEINEAVPGWLDSSKAYDVYIMKTALPTMFQNLKLKNESLWAEFMASSSPQCPKHCNLSEFQVILLIQALRPDRLYSALVQFSIQILGLPSLSSPTLHLNNLVKEATQSEPILLITSPGADPSEEINALAQKKMKNKYTEVALGQVNVTEILQLLSNASKNGHWLMLKNLHLLTYWLPTLEKELQILSPKHKEFRLWLTTEPHSNFSPVLLSACIKITYEAPEGIKHNLERTYSAWDANKSFPKSLESSRAMFALAWFHAVVQERRTYIPQGWTSFYEFNDSDLQAAVHVIRKITSLKNESNKTIQWQYVHGLCENTIYGGRVDNPYDFRILSSYLSSFFHEEVMNHYGKPIVSGIYIPQSPDIKEHFQVIQKLPSTDLPEFFGLPANVDRSWQRITSLKTINQLKVLGKPSDKGEKLVVSELYTQISPILKTWKKLNTGVGLVHGDPPPVCLDDSPILVFLSLEYSFAFDLVNQVHQSLATISRIIKGLDPETENVAVVVKAIIEQKTPEEWESFWEGPINPLRYIQSVMTRAVNIRNLFTDWKNLSKRPIDLAGFFHVDAFFSALRQQVARSQKVSIEELCLTTNWDVKDEQVKDGHVLVEGLQLEGALFDKNKLTVCLSESPSICILPTVSLTWIHNANRLPHPVLSIPLYSSSNRQKLITELEIPCERNEKNRWIQTGTAFYLHS